MSSNFFAALDDSGDESPAKVVKDVEKKKKAPAAKKTVVEPSKVDDKKKPNQNDRNTKFGRGGRAPPREGKRAYERRSGTGRGKEIKKGGGGARNWGSDQNEARQAKGVVDEEQLEVQVEGLEVTETAVEATPPEPPEPPEPQPEPEPEDKTMSYEEYLASKARPKNEAFAPVAERTVTNEFGSVKAREVVEEDFLVMGGGKQKKAKNKTKEIIKLTPAFRVEPNANNSGGRGRGDRGRESRGREGRHRGEGRGEGRGTGDRKEGRGGRGPRGSGRGSRGSGRGSGRGRDGFVSDETAFPSL